MNTTTKTIYGFTKSKAYGLCGVALAMAFLGTGSVSADEVTPADVDSAVAVTATVSSVSPEVVTEQPVALEKADLIVSEVTPSQIQPTTVESTPVLAESIKQAETAGVEVTQNPTVDKGNVKSADEEAAKVAEIQADYSKQAEAIKKATEEVKKSQSEYEYAKKAYDEQVAKREAALKNPTYKTGSNTFEKGELDEFLKATDLSKVSYVTMTDENLSVLNTDKLTKLTFDEYKAYFGDQNIKDEGLRSIYKELEDGKDTNYYNLKKGDTFKFENTFLDAATGKWVSLKYTVKEIFDASGNPANNGFVKITNGLNLTAFANTSDVKYQVEFVDQDGNPVELEHVIIGYGDVDGSQRLLLVSDKLSDKVLFGNNLTVTKEGNEVLVVSTPEVVPSSDLISNQAWFLLNKATGFDYSYSATVWNNGRGGKDTMGWHQIGAIPFGIEIPPVPVAPTKPETKKVSYTLASYNKVGSVKIRVETTDGFVFDEESHVDIPTGTDFDSSKTKGNLVNINGRPYRIVEIKGNETGKIELGEKEIIYVVKPQVTTTWITEGGDPLKDPSTGDETEPHGEFPEYEFVKTNPKPDGSVEHVFKKVEKPVVPTPEEPKAPAKPIVTPTVNKPEVPQVPQAPVQETPKPVVQESVATLPNTGTEASVMSLLGGFMASLTGASLFVSKRKRG